MYMNANMGENYEKVFDMCVDGEYVEKMKLLKKCIMIAVCTKNNNENIGDYEDGMQKSYYKIKEMIDELSLSKKSPTIQQEILVIELLDLVFYTKRTENTERIMRYNQLCAFETVDKTVINCIKDKIAGYCEK